MTPLIVSCLSQKGGVGKSTLARLLAVGYAENDWTVKLADFNGTQLTSAKWHSKREKDNIGAKINAEAYTKPSNLEREPFDIVIADGRPDSHQSSLTIAQLSTVVFLPTGLGSDDLEPTVAFALELVEKGVKKDKIVFVLNKLFESDIAEQQARELIENNGFRIAKTGIRLKASYGEANSTGYALNEVKFPSLKVEAQRLLGEMFKIVDERAAA